MARWADWARAMLDAGPQRRHTCASMLVCWGWNAKQVQVVVGHHSPAFTLATHVHPCPSLPVPRLFTAEERAVARRRLEEYGFEISRLGR